MSHNRNKIIVFFLALILLAGSLGGNALSFAASNRIEIELPSDGKLLKALQSSPGALDYRAWEIGSAYSYKDYVDDRVRMLSELTVLSDGTLDADFVPYTFKGICRDGKVMLDGIPTGLFYFKNSFADDDTKYAIEFVVYISSAVEAVQIVGKVQESPLGTGQVKLIKKDQDGYTLEGVAFELYSVRDGKTERVPLNGANLYDKDNPSDQTLLTDKKGEIWAGRLPYGKYFFKEVKALAGYRFMQERLYFDLTDEKLIELQAVNVRIKEGGFRFLKVANDSAQSPLQGAVFKVTQEIDGEYQTVVQDGKELYLTSDRDGKFEVCHLPYGDYYLFEVQAPKGYQSLTHAIKFTVEDALNEKLMIIKNEREPEKPVPRTGETSNPAQLGMALLLTAAGIILLGIKSRKKTER